MTKAYLKQLFPGVAESKLAIPYFTFTERAEEEVEELRVGIRYSSSLQHQSRGGVPSYPLYKPTSIANYPILSQILLEKCQGHEEVL